MKLSKSRRKKLPSSTFGLPEKKAYPMPDRQHAIEAKSGASHAEHVGNITPAEEKRIDAKADRILGKKGKQRKPKYEGETHAYNWRNRHGLARSAQ